jgi:hypothetical protein
MAKKKRTVKSLILEKKREAMKEAGAYDGRFKERVVKDKTKYSRKNKGKDNL